MMGLKCSIIHTNNVHEVISEPFVTGEDRDDIYVMTKDLRTNSIYKTDVDKLDKVLTDAEYEAWNKS